MHSALTRSAESTSVLSMFSPIRQAVFALIVFAWSSASGQPFGLTNRVPNTTLRMPIQLPIYGFMLTNAFENVADLRQSTVALASPDGETNRLFIVEKAGRIIVITN